MTSPNNFFISLILVNSLIIILLVLNQNDGTKDLVNQQTRSSINPLEKLTWLGLILQLIFLLIQLKITEV